jgi:oligopeptide/dipeptide ABC transporter ATP-binding protein
VIADEPTASVDASTTSQILAFIRNFADTNGTAFVIISHDPDALATIADRIVVMYAGKVIEDGPAQEVFANPSHPYTSALMKCSPRKPVVELFHGKRQLPYIPGESPDPSEITAGCAFAARCTDRMAECTTDKPKLLQESKGRFVRCFKYGVG